MTNKERRLLLLSVLLTLSFPILHSEPILFLGGAIGFWLFIKFILDTDRGG